MIGGRSRPCAVTSSSETFTGKMPRTQMCPSSSSGMNSRPSWGTTTPTVNAVSTPKAASDDPAVIEDSLAAATA